jgi:1,4-alpha-glucan branching enzyme
MIKIHDGMVSRNGRVRVTFSMPAIEDCERLYLVGWFTEWDETVYPMEQTRDGEWAITLELEGACTYLYRFRTLDGRWLNDSSGPPVSELGLNTAFVINMPALAGAAPSD